MSFREKWMHQLLLNLMKFQEAENYMLYINSAERSYAEPLSLISSKVSGLHAIVQSRRVDSNLVPKY